MHIFFDSLWTNLILNCLLHDTPIDLFFFFILCYFIMFDILFCILYNRPMNCATACTGYSPLPLRYLNSLMPTPKTKMHEGLLATFYFFFFQRKFSLLFLNKFHLFFFLKPLFIPAIYHYYHYLLNKIFKFNFFCISKI